VGASAADTGAVECNGAERVGKMASQAVRGAEPCRFLAGAVRPGAGLDFSEFAKLLA
jgi:hypothetical protein